MKNEVFKFGKKVMFAAGKYKSWVLYGMSAGATMGAIFLAVQAGMEYQRLKDLEEELTWKDYGRIFGPCMAAGVFALACGFAGLNDKEKKYAAAAALASMYESKGDEFEAKAREIFGDKEVDKAQDEIMKDKLNNAPEPMINYTGTAFLDIVTGQYIYMDYEVIRTKVNDMNDHMNSGHDISKSEWCDNFDLMSTKGDDELGWCNELTGNIHIKPFFHTLASGRTVAALRVLEEPRLFSEKEEYYTDEEIDEYYRQRNPGWSEV